MVRTVNSQPALSSSAATASDHGRSLRWGCLGIQAGVYAWLAYLSRRFDFVADFSQRPILLALLLLAIAFGLHLWSLRLSLRSPNQFTITREILLGAILFRAILLPSLPIQEVDLYRYLWDGAVVANGENPYSLSPQQVLTASDEQEGPSALKTLVALRMRSSACDETLRRIHFGELITVYPPISQVVFGLASWVVPDPASLYQHVVTMKVVLTLFDLLTVWLLLAILRRVGRHAGWAMLYAWSPLVLKECANSGHLDSIAVCLTTAAVLGLLHAIGRTRSRMGWIALSAGILGMGVGAKLYPIVLIPVLTLWAARQLGCRAGGIYLGVAMSSTFASLAPMLLTPPTAIEVRQRADSETVERPETPTAGSGLATFLTRWEINDLAFLVVVENLRPDSVEAAPHWFVFAPKTLRASMAEFLSSTWGQPVAEATFLTARLISLLTFAVIALGLLWRASCQNEDELWLRTVFLTLAWFWCLAPTLNPWYWTWALPFLPFAGRRSWAAVSLLVLAYYLRFWLLYQFPESQVLGTRYQGEQFFHFVVAPVEHGLWMLALLAESLIFSGVWPRSQTDGVSPP